MSSCPTLPKAAEAPSAESVFFAGNGGLRIAYEAIGDGEPLVLIPGYSQSRRAWELAGFVREFAARGRMVILIDPRGHGQSDKPHAPSAYADNLLGSDVTAVLDRLGIGKADLLGYSRGGTIAIATAIAHPERVRRLALGGSHPYAEDMSAFRNAVAPGLGNWIGVIEANAGPLPCAAREMFLANDVEALRAAVADDRPDLSAELAARAIPTLLYAGSEDSLAPCARRFAAATGADFLELPDLNHFQAFFAVDAVVAAVERLDRLLADGKP